MAQISFGFSGGFLANQLAFVPGFAGLIGFHVRLPRSGWESDCVAESRLAAFRRSDQRVQPARNGRSLGGCRQAAPCAKRS